jgi:hypothetical protein
MPTVPKGVLIGSVRVRDDLWMAIIDYRSGRQYVWDPVTRLARPGRADEGLAVLPTLDKREAKQLRSDFLDLHKASLDRTDLTRALRWKEQGLATVHLPAALQEKWKREITQRVRARVVKFFEEQKRIRAQEKPTPDVPPPVEPMASPLPLFDEEAVRAARERGHSFVAGELVARGLATAPDDELDGLLARAIGAWSSPLQPTQEPVGIADFVSRIDEFDAANVTLAVVRALQRLRHLQRKTPDILGDIVFRVRDEISRIYGVDSRKRPLEMGQLAAARLDAALANISASVESFLRTTPSTAKAISLDILRHCHQLQPLIIATERGFLRELETVVGAAFRKFCESVERGDSASVVRRAPDLRETLQRYTTSSSDQRQYSALWGTVVVPVIQHVTTLIEEATTKGEASLLPVLALVSATTKAHLQSVNQDINLSFRLANKGRGEALNVSMEMLPHDAPAILLLTEPRSQFAIGPESDQLVSLVLMVSTAVPELRIPIRWTCQTAAGSARSFDDHVVIHQQSMEPNWDALLADPPYSLNPIKRRDRLFGRDTTLHQLRLAALAGASTFLWGQKRIGKTSLLQVLASDLMGRPDVTCVILRMGEITSLHEGQLAQRIAERLVTSSKASIDVPTEDDLGAGMSRLVPFVERLVAQRPEYKFVIIIDEFDDLDVAFYTGERGRQFIKALRSLSEIGLTFFFVGSERMDMIYRRHQTDLNKWRNLALDRIDNRHDCTALITSPVSGAIEYAPQAVDFIIDYCGRNPFYIHNFCYQVFERCVQEHRTYVSENDLQISRQKLLQSLGPTNFAHFWEDNPELDPTEKLRQTAENCIALTCIAVLGGRFDSPAELFCVQDSLAISNEDRAPDRVLRSACERLKNRKILASLPGEEGVIITLPILREWLAENADSWLIPIWKAYCGHARTAMPVAVPLGPILETTAFPIAEDDLIAVSQRLVYCGHQKDAAEIRQWLRQFDDESRIEIAFLLLKRLAERGFINEGTRSRALHKITEMINNRRLEIGEKVWRVIRGRLDNLCIAYVDSELKSGAATARELQKIMRPGKCGDAGEIASWMRSHIKEDPLVVVVDDFSGTGTTMRSGLKKLKNEVDPAIWKKYVADGRISTYIMFAFPEALQKIRDECPGVETIAATTLGEDLRALDADAHIFADEPERRFATDVLTQIGRELIPQTPLGFGDMGGLVVFHNAAPNNTLPIFWSHGRVSERLWKPLFPRA